MTMKRCQLHAFALAGLLAAAPAFGHDDATLDKTAAPNGGQLRMAGPYHFELVVAPAAAQAKDAPVRVYVTDHAGTKVATAGAKGSVTILGGGAKVSLPLVPDGDNAMRGQGAYRSSADMKVIVSVTLAGQPAQSARFTPLAALTTMDHAKH